MAHGSEDLVHYDVVSVVCSWSMDSGALVTNLEAEILAEVELA